MRGEDAPAPVVDVSRFRRPAGPSRLPLLMGAGGGAVVLIAAVGGILLFWGRGDGNPNLAAPPPKDQVAQAPSDKSKPDNPNPSGSPPPRDKPADAKPPPPDTHPKPPPPTDPVTPPTDPTPAVPEVPEAWKETALADLPPELEAKVVDKINAARKAAGLTAVAADADASKGCSAHAAYLARNAGRIAALGLNVHAEDAALPGQSEAGGKAAEAATIAAKEPLAALDDWTALPAHRALILHPKLKTIGLGFAHNARDQWASVFLLPGPTADAPTEGEKAVLYPGDGQTRAPLFFPGAEIPDPLPDVKAKTTTSGFPVTVTFPAKVKVKGAEARLEDESGKEIDAWFSSPEKPANDRFASDQQNSICLIAKAPLRPGVRYAVLFKAKVDQRDWQAAWSFVTAGPEDLRRTFEDRFLARINAARERAGLEPTALDPAPSLACAAHAHYMALNFPAHPDLNLRDENPDWPGYTDEGRKAAGQSICQLRTLAPEQCVDLLMSALGARMLFLEPKFRQVALGSSWMGSSAGSWVLTAPQLGEWTEVHPIILYPAPDQKGVPTLYGAEAPSAVPEEGKGKPAGLPVTVRFPWHKPLDNVTGRLTDASGQEVATWLSTPQKPLPGVALFLVTLLPREPLREGETYTATVAADFNGEAWKKTWSFTTRKRGEVDAPALEAKILARVNDARNQAGLKPVEMDAALSRGCQQHAHYLVLNEGRPAVAGLGVHKEDSTYPGATPEGAKAAAAAVVADFLPDPADAVDRWISTFFHRIPILNPDLHKIGFGCAQSPNDTWTCVMDVQGGK